MEETEKTVVTDMVTGTTNIKCTNFCGFSVEGTPDYCKKLFILHDHQEHPSTHESNKWYDAVFSMEGVIIAFIVCGLIVSVVFALIGKH